jgi:hypothetical protein
MINPDRVSDIFEECFISRGEVDGEVHVDSMAGIVSFKNNKVELHKQEIENMLCELPIEFRKTSGGGWSLLNGCIDKDGCQWTGFQSTVLQLFTLGMAIGKVNYLTPRDMWVLLPGKVPYFVIDM